MMAEGRKRKWCRKCLAKENMKAFRGIPQVILLSALCVTLVSAGCRFQCGTNAHCDDSQCVCDTGFYGIPEYRCSAPQCTHDEECSDTHYCHATYRYCVHACERCPQDIGCLVVNHTEECIYDGISPFDNFPHPY